MRALQDAGRPPDYKGLTAEHRARANYAQFIAFSRTYWPMWRYVKINLYSRLLAERDAIAMDLPAILPGDPVSPRSRAYQDVTNGLLAAAASEFCQYAEDLAVLCHALHSNGYFARDLTRFDAGKMKTQVNSWIGVDRAKTCSTLLIPQVDPGVPWPNDDVRAAYETGVDRAAELLDGISAAYTAWYHHFIRYKHGLLLALAPYAPEIGDDYILEHRGNTRGLPVAFDAASVNDIVGRPEFRDLLCIADLSCEHVKWNALTLSRENNLLRYVMPMLRDGEQPTMKEFESAAFAVGQLQQVVIHNYRCMRNPDRRADDWDCLLPHGRAFTRVASKVPEHAGHPAP